LSHGIAASLGGNSQQDLPFNKRFFPGGQNSIRGYQDGEAAPRDAFGRVIGVETYLLGTVEFEQALTPKWSLVAFSDSIGFARQLRQYPFDETLYSVGGGVRWKTVVGPVRLEYGHNLNPRPGDPKGTLHFSLGFPF
jgi:outer membrane translocation and assembly module TamA